MSPQNNYKNHIYNILATLASISSYVNIKDLKKDLFFNFQTPNGRGDISKIKFKKKNFFLVDESYNSNPLSLKTAIENFDKEKVQKTAIFLDKTFYFEIFL